MEKDGKRMKKVEVELSWEVPCIFHEAKFAARELRRNDQISKGRASCNHTILIISHRDDGLSPPDPDFERP